MLVFHLTAATNPVIALNPTTIVMAISVGENRPVIIRAHPSKNSQMKIMTANQTTKQGTAAHLAICRFWKPATIGNQSGSVCTS